MSELMFTLKCLLFTVLLTVLMQVRIGGGSMEEYAQWWMKKSSVSIYIQSVAAGGVLALRNLGHSAKSAATGVVDGYQQGSRQQANR